MWLTWLADALRGAGLTVVEYEGWQTRCKSSGEYKEGRPWGVMWHHSASPASTDPEDLAEYCCYGADAAPVCNVNVERDGTVWVLAAGPTNTNGNGNAYGWSKGAVPADSMNSYAFGMELSNNGTGEPYPAIQIDAAFTISNVVNQRCGNQPTDVGTHFDYAPGRKIDPAKASAVQGPWRPGSVGNSTDTWDVGSVATECARRAQAPQPGEDDMALLYVEVSDAYARFVGTGQRDPLALWQVGYVSNEGGNPRADVYNQTLPHVVVTKAQLSGCSLIGDPPPADDGGGPASWAVGDFFEHIPKG
jgi:hypothetical protein